MTDNISEPWMTDNLERARSFREGSAKRFSDGRSMLGFSLFHYWLHYRNSPKRGILLLLQILLELMGFRQQKEYDSSDNPPIKRFVKR